MNLGIAKAVTQSIEMNLEIYWFSHLDKLEYSYAFMRNNRKLCLDYENMLKSEEHSRDEKPVDKQHWFNLSWILLDRQRSLDE